MKQNLSASFCCHCWLPFVFKVIWTLLFCRWYLVAFSEDAIAVDFKLPFWTAVSLDGMWKEPAADLSFLESPHSRLRTEIMDDVVPVHFVHESSKVGQGSTRTERSELVFGAGWKVARTSQAVPFISELIQAFNEFISALAASLVAGRRNYHSCPKHPYPVKPPGFQMMH